MLFFCIENVAHHCYTSAMQLSYAIIGAVGSIIGLIASVYIYRKKRLKQKLVCPRTASCDTVVHSTFATTFGIQNDILGLIYYITLGLLYSVLLLRGVLPFCTMSAISAVPFVWLQFAITVITAGGVLFSVYLVAVQALRLHTWCAWCMLSAFANVVLLVALFFFPRADLYTLLGAQKILWVIVHNIGFILGVGAATITDIFFFRFLKDNRITEAEKDTMDTLSAVIWVGLAILIVSGVFLYLPQQLRLDQSSKFLVKVVVVTVVTINGLLLNIFVAPKMRSLSFAEHPKAAHFRRIAFALGGISITSWYTAFFLGSLRSIPITAVQGLWGYGGLIVAVIIGSQIFERITVAQHKTDKHSIAE